MANAGDSASLPPFPATASRSQRWWSRLGIKLIARRIDTYQPLLCAKRKDALRKTIDRWNAIERDLGRLSPKTILDIGCAQGYFTLRAAESTDALCIGLDASPINLWFAANQMLAGDHMRRYGFICTKFDMQTLNGFSQQDIILCLSVFHHIFCEKGADYATTLMRGIREHTGKAMFFEMGQSNEVAEPWARFLPEMGSDPNAWVSAWLQECGWARPELIGEFPNHTNDVLRGLWLCER